MANTRSAKKRVRQTTRRTSVNRAFETGLSEGVRFERRLFQATFGTPDQREGMAAFVEKRKPAYRKG